MAVSPEVVAKRKAEAKKRSDAARARIAAQKAAAEGGPAGAGAGAEAMVTLKETPAERAKREAKEAALKLAELMAKEAEARATVEAEFTGPDVLKDVFAACEARAATLTEDKKAKAWPMPARFHVPKDRTDLDELVATFGDAVTAVGDMAGTPVAYVKNGRWRDVALFLRDSLGYNHCSFVSAADYDQEGILEAHAQLAGATGGKQFVIKTILPRHGAELASLVPVWAGANWHEREAFDMFGITFHDHPHHARIFLPDGWHGHPLLKDYDEKEQFIGLGEDGEDVVYTTPGPNRW